MQITKGEELIKAYHDAEQDSGNTIDRHFCLTCGTPLYIKGEKSRSHYAVFYSALDNTGNPKPVLEYYTKDRVSWLPELEGTKKPA